MSFILDALRKSERERQQQAAPGIGDVAHRPSKKGSNRWLIALLVILGLNALLVVALLLRGQGQAPDTRSVQPAPVPRAAPAPARRPALTAPKREDIRPLAEEVSDADPADASPAMAMAAPTPPAPAPVATPRPAPQRAAPASASASASADSISSGLPSMEELVLDGQLEMQPLRLDMHVYSEQPAQRFVFINMSKYREGEALKEGPRVDTITAEGVVLIHQGKRFVLTR
jgi:general secretion pathway protein B